ncbi:MAG: prolyl oligopeptidase family serine peptidase [Bacteroidetes bacterium]|nr:prolyl oligopeptidase family serine peptidase [Bacteroidota bacterium]
MKTAANQTITLVLFIFLIVQFSAAQKIAGTWQGRLYILGKDTRIVFHFTPDSIGKLKGTMDVPKEMTLGIVVDEIELIGDSLSFYIPELSAEFTGVMKKDSDLIPGYFRQNGVKFSLSLFKGEEEDLLYHRPQKPAKPYPYQEEEVSILNLKGSDTLAGTLTKPNINGKHPAIIMITGSGPEDRDETVFGHKPFLIIADYLTRMGFAVLRCDDRGTSKSTGNFRSATSSDFADDVEAQLNYLLKRPDIDIHKIGLIGHSEGGIIAPMVAARRNEVAFIVMLAGPSINMFDLLLVQDSMVSATNGMSSTQIAGFVNKNKKLFEFVQSAKDSATAADSIDHYLSGKGMDNEVLLSIRQLCSPWMRWFIGFDPAVNLRKLNCAVLALNGEKDIQVPASLNIAVIEKILKESDNKNYKTLIIPGLNHLFQPCNSCSISEYANINLTIDPSVLKTIGEWLEDNVSSNK